MRSPGLFLPPPAPAPAPPPLLPPPAPAPASSAAEALASAQRRAGRIGEPLLPAKRAARRCSCGDCLEGGGGSSDWGCRGNLAQPALPVGSPVPSADTDLEQALRLSAQLAAEEEDRQVRSAIQFSASSLSASFGSGGSAAIELISDSDDEPGAR
mmetsp:Transcript_106833/g.271307  ORF Transcript_106833/g.271307 Transcript_106833/m.271307 type:complete len:155 (-) Transcript_106833:61-525(-)